MKLTLLEIVQDILSDMDSDEVNSIDDTTEAQQVARIVKNVYMGMMSNRNWAHTRKAFQLVNLSDIDRPNYLKLPKGMKELSFFDYDKSKPTDTNELYQPVKYLHPDSFLRMISGRGNQSFVTRVVDFSGVALLINNNTPPQYWTSFDDVHVVTDAYDKDKSNTLIGSDSRCVGYFHPEWVHADTAIPDLPDEAFAALMAESLSVASLRLKQLADQKAEQQSVKQQRWLSRKASNLDVKIRYPDFGRKARK